MKKILIISLSFILIISGCSKQNTKKKEVEDNGIKNIIEEIKIEDIDLEKIDNEAFGAFETITVVGVPKTGVAGNGGDVTLTFSETPLRGDVVIVFGGQSEAGLTVGIGTVGYTEILNNSPIYNNISVRIWYKVMGESPDTNVLCEATTWSSSGSAFGSYVLRGVDIDNVFDTSSVEGRSLTSSPEITTVTDGSMVISFGFDAGYDTSIGTISGYSNLATTAVNESEDLTIGAMTKIITTAGAENPGAWSSWTTLGYVATIAIRPAEESLERRYYIIN